MQRQSIPEQVSGFLNLRQQAQGLDMLSVLHKTAQLS